MTIRAKPLTILFHSARVVLWLPIALNASATMALLGAPIVDSLLLSVSLASIASFGFVINDLADIDIDEENDAGKLERASSGVLRLARLLAGAFFLLSLFLSLALGIRAILSVLAVALGLVVYTHAARPKLLLANLLSSTLASTPLWLPNVIVGIWPHTFQWLIIVVSATILLGREIVFDAEDAPGDAKAKRVTLPIIAGRQVATRISAGLQLISCIVLLVFSLKEAIRLSLAGQLSLLLGISFLLILLMPINARLLWQSFDATLLKTFTTRSRMAMLFLPVILVAFFLK